MLKKQNLVKENILTKVTDNAEKQNIVNEMILAKVMDNAEKQDIVNWKVNDNFELHACNFELLKTDNENMLDKLDQFGGCCNIM